MNVNKKTPLFLLVFLLPVFMFQACLQSDDIKKAAAADENEVLAQEKAKQSSGCFHDFSCTCEFPQGGIVKWIDLIDYLDTRADSCWLEECSDAASCDPYTITESNLLCDFETPLNGFEVLTNINPDQPQVLGMICLIENYIENNRPNFNGQSYKVKDIEFFKSERPCEELVFQSCYHSCGTCFDPPIPEFNQRVRTIGLTITYVVCSPAGCL